MLKLAALMGIVAGCGLGGILKAAELKERIRLLDEFFKMILSLKSEINYFREPLAVVLERQSHHEDTEAFQLLREILLMMQFKSGGKRFCISMMVQLRRRKTGDCFNIREDFWGRQTVKTSFFILNIWKICCRNNFRRQESVIR